MTSVVRERVLLGFLASAVTFALLAVVSAPAFAEPPPEPCEWDAELAADDPNCVEPEPEPVGCDAMAGMVDTNDGGCAQLVRFEPAWTEVAMVFGMGVLVALGALVVSQLMRR